MSEYCSHYHNYVTHTLNSSPSKSAFTFPKAERFPTQYVGEPGPEPDQRCMHANGFSYYRYSPPRRINTSRNGHSVKYVQSSTPYDWKVRKEVDRILGRIQREKQYQRDKSRSYSPNKHYPHLAYYQENGRGKSPQKVLTQSRQNKSRSPQRSKQCSPQRGTVYRQLKDLNHPSQNMTLAGYYPVGTEISPTGRYVSSKVKNVVGAKFGSSSTRREQGRARCDNLGPGYYNHFSQFGP